nr:hypothetical protein [uncultured archaeon]
MASVGLLSDIVIVLYQLFYFVGYFSLVVFSFPLTYHPF